MFLETWPMAIALGLGTIAFRIDTIILSLIKGQDAVGIYGVPYKIIDILITIPNIFMGLVLPIISIYIISNRRRLIRVLQKSFDAMAVVGFYILMIISLLAPFIINLVAGSGFVASTTPLRYLAFAICAVFIGMPMPYLLVAAKKQKQLIWRNLFLLFVNIILNLILIPSLSYNGAAIATLVAETISAIFTFYLAWKTVKILPSFNKFLGIIASSVLSFLIGFLIIKSNAPINWSHFADLTYASRALYFLLIFLVVTFFYLIFLIIFKGIDRRVAAELIPIRIKVRK
jgi:O-antigen/teichoic acid export membrane protein